MADILSAEKTNIASKKTTNTITIIKIIVTLHPPPYSYTQTEQPDVLS